MLRPYSKELKFDPYKVALVELGIEHDEYYQNQFLQNVDSSETTKDKTSRIKAENASELELFQLEKLLSRFKGLK